MLGRGSIPLARVFGIRIGVHPSWFIILFLLIWSLSGGYQDALDVSNGTAFVLATISALLLFASIILHELGHAIVARRNGIAISGIDLWVFGGLAWMRREPPSAGVEFRVAAAGPLVSLAIALGCFGLGALAAGGHDFGQALAYKRHADVTPALAVLAYLGEVNTFLLAINLIPGYPLDGGRIARALVWWRTGDRLRATRFAAGLGRGFAYLLAALGLLALVRGGVLFGLSAIFISMFLNQAARSAEQRTALSHQLEGLTVADVMDDEPVAIPGRTTLDHALDDFFLRYGWPWFPVVDTVGRFVGVLTRQKLDDVPEQIRSEYRVEQAMALDRTGTWHVRTGDPIESVLSAEGLARLGALVAVDDQGILRGVLTSDRLRRALTPTLPKA